nr:MAG TPA: Meiotic chromosome segregation protein [Caudoviricetes sp.]
MKKNSQLVQSVKAAKGQAGSYTKPAFSQDPTKQERLDRQYGGLHRTCTVCGETKPARAFATLRCVQNGLNRRTVCRRCVTKAQNAKSHIKYQQGVEAERQRLAEAQIPPHLNPINQLIVCQWQP